MRARGFPFGFSLAIHAAVLAWVAAGPVREAAKKAPSLYDVAIRPYEKHIVWYSVRDKLPEISPIERRGPSRPPRAEHKAAQAVVAAPVHAPKSPQLVWLPAPPARLKTPFRSPNLLAFHARTSVPSPPPRARLFAPPPERPAAPRPAPVLTAPPELHATADVKPPLPGPVRLEPRAFRPQLQARRADESAPALAAPPLVAVNPRLALPVDSGAAKHAVPRVFRPLLPAQPAAGPAPALTAPPLVAVDAKLALPVASGAATRAVPRVFHAPVEVARVTGPAPAVAAPPRLGASPDALPEGLGPSTSAPARPAPRAFHLPAADGHGTPRRPLPRPSKRPPWPPSAGPPGVVSMAIVGLDPAAHLDAPPEGSRDARFSAGPVRRAEGSDGEPVSSARVFVPGLMVAKGPPPRDPVLIAHVAPTSPENIRNILRAAPVGSVPPPAPATGAQSVAPPEALLGGRAVYSMTVQMPNISSYIGSWLVWFAGRGDAPGASAGIQAPVPLHKVDPKYAPAAMADRIEGVVRLTAVIRADGSVDSVAVISHLDDRLDAAAREALSKWRFTPGRRGGRPIELDAVVDIPFRLAPLVRR